MPLQTTSRSAEGDDASRSSASGTDPLVDPLMAVQLMASSAPSAERTRRAASDVLATPNTRLPHGDAIQASFGHHAVADTPAHVGPAVTEHLQGIGAEGLAAGGHAAFAGAPSVHTAAHEATHIVQGRAGLKPSGGVGQAGDTYEQQADAVADTVASGQSAESMLDDIVQQGTPGGGSADFGGVQLKLTRAEDAEVSRSAAALDAVLVAPQRANFHGPWTRAQRVAWLVGRAEVGAMVENAGQERLKHAAVDKHGGGAAVLTNVTLRLTDRTGAQVLAPLVEIDALVCDEAGAVQDVVSAKLNPAAVHPSRDRTMLAGFYEPEPAISADASSKECNNYFGKLIAAFGSALGPIGYDGLAGHHVRGLSVTHDGTGAGTSTLAAFRAKHPLGAASASEANVIGMTPKPDTRQGQRNASDRGDVTMDVTRDELLDKLIDKMLAM